MGNVLGNADATIEVIFKDVDDNVLEVGCWVECTKDGEYDADNGTGKVTNVGEKELTFFFPTFPEQPDWNYTQESITSFGMRLILADIDGVKFEVGQIVENAGEAGKPETVNRGRVLEVSATQIVVGGADDKNTICAGQTEIDEAGMRVYKEKSFWSKVCAGPSCLDASLPDASPHPETAPAPGADTQAPPVDAPADGAAPSLEAPAADSVPSVDAPADGAALPVKP